MEKDADRTRRFCQRLYFAEDNSPQLIKDARSSVERDVARQTLLEGVETTPKREGLGRDACVATLKAALREGEP